MGLALLEDAALVEERHPVGHVAGEPHLVGRDDHRHPLLGELADRIEHLRDEHRVERARDLVEQQDVGLHRERADDGDALLLSAREPVRVLVGLVREPEPREELVGTRVRLGVREPQHLDAARG